MLSSIWGFQIQCVWHPGVCPVIRFLSFDLQLCVLQKGSEDPRRAGNPPCAWELCEHKGVRPLRLLGPRWVSTLPVSPSLQGRRVLEQRLLPSLVAHWAGERKQGCRSIASSWPAAPPPLALLQTHPQHSETRGEAAAAPVRAAAQKAALPNARQQATGGQKVKTHRLNRGLRAGIAPGLTQARPA